MKGLLKNLAARLANQNGFTVLESILTTSVLSLGFLGGLVVMQNAVANTAKGDRTSIAVQLAQEKGEEIMADNVFRGYDFASDCGNYADEDFDDKFEGFSRGVEISEVSASDLSTPETGSGLSKITVTVKWGSEKNQFVTYSTLISNN